MARLKTIRPGEAYIARNGATVTVAESRFGSVFPYVGSNGLWYYRDGRADRTWHTSFDLVRLAKKSRFERAVEALQTLLRAAV